MIPSKLLILCSARGAQTPCFPLRDSSGGLKLSKHLQQGLHRPPQGFMASCVSGTNLWAPCSHLVSEDVVVGKRKARR